MQFKGEDENYFCPLDVDLADPERKNLISLTEIYAQLEDCRARRKLLLVDACRSEPTRIDFRNDVQLESVTLPQLADPPEGVVALFSCAEGQEAIEDPDLEHGVFFYHVLQALDGEADDGDRQVTLDELLAFAKSRTARYARVELNAAQ